MREEAREHLDEAQRRAVESTARYLLVTAPPGSGKTRVLASRFARLVAECGPSGVLAVTFTNRAAREMQGRASCATGLTESRLNVSTFHAFCLGFLKPRAPNLRLIGRAEQVEILRSMGISAPDKAADRISAMKNMGADGRASGEDAGLLERYAVALAEGGAVDLDDLVLKAIEALEAYAGDGGLGPGLFAHVLVDEYQDINPSQARLTRLLAGEGGSVAAIGDPDQSIYGFRGAGRDAFPGFLAAYPGADVIELSTNYRSGACVVAASESVIDGHSARGGGGGGDVEAARDGGAVTVVDSADDTLEADFIAGEIEALMGGLTNIAASGARGRGACADDLRFSDFAVLARTNAQARSLAVSFERTSIPFQLVGPSARGEGALIAALAAAEAGPDDTPADVVRRVAGETGATEEATGRVLVEAAGVDGTGPEALSAFVERMLLEGLADRFDITADRVSIMTMHMTKGLEFDTVFVTGVEDGIVPLALTSGESDEAEERRLFYVAMTRARERLYISHAARRRIWGETRTQSRSPFVDAIPVGSFREIRLERKIRKKRPVQDSLF